MTRIALVLMVLMIAAFPVYADSPKIQPLKMQQASPDLKFKKKNKKRPMIKLPDLVVEEFVLFPGKNYSFLDYRLKIKNIGAKAFYSGKVKAVFLLKSTSIGTDVEFYVPEPGQSKVIHGTKKLWIPLDTCQSATYTVTLDRQNQLAESNENNNTAEHTALIQGRPDVGFCHYGGRDCKIMFMNSGVGQDTYIGFEIYNYGCVASPGCKVDLIFPGQWPQSVNIPSIQPGKFYAFHTYLKWSSPGVRMGELVLKHTHDDARERNDRVKFKVNIAAQ